MIRTPQFRVEHVQTIAIVGIIRGEKGRFIWNHTPECCLSEMTPFGIDKLMSKSMGESVGESVARDAMLNVTTYL